MPRRTAPRVATASFLHRRRRMGVVPTARAAPCRAIVKSRANSAVPRDRRRRASRSPAQATRLLHEQTGTAGWRGWRGGKAPSAGVLWRLISFAAGVSAFGRRYASRATGGPPLSASTMCSRGAVTTLLLPPAREMERRRGWERGGWCEEERKEERA